MCLRMRPRSVDFWIQLSFLFVGLQVAEIGWNWASFGNVTAAWCGACLYLTLMSSSVLQLSFIRWLNERHSTRAPYLYIFAQKYERNSWIAALAWILCYAWHCKSACSSSFSALCFAASWAIGNLLLLGLISDFENDEANVSPARIAD